MFKTSARSILTFGLAATTAIAPAFSADWPQWRGPLRNGISTETGLLTEWPAGGPKQLWEIDTAGSGYSTPSIVGDRLYLLGNAGLDDEFVRAFDVRDGKQLWSTHIGKVGNPDQKPPYPGSRSTATVDGDLLYALGSDGDLACLDVATGEIRWAKNVRTDFGGKPGVWAYSESPLVDGNRVVVSPGGADATLVALDKTTGDLIWKSPLAEGDDAGYASILPIEFEGQRQYVQFLAKGLVGVDAETGAFLWRYGKTAEGSSANIPTPVESDGLVYSAAGRTGGGLVRLKREGDAIKAEEVYFSPKLPVSIGGTVESGGYLYGTNRQGLLCVEFVTGEVKWQDRCVGAGSVLLADGLLYVYGEGGEAALVAATPDGYREKGRFTPANKPDAGSSKSWAYPVIADGRLYLRDMNKLWCYDVHAGQSAGLSRSK